MFILHGLKPEINTGVGKWPEKKRKNLKKSQKRNGKRTWVSNPSLKIEYRRGDTMAKRGKKRVEEPEHWGA